VPELAHEVLVHGDLADGVALGHRARCAQILDRSP
jgi:hypothetical protein